MWIKITEIDFNNMKDKINYLTEEIDRIKNENETYFQLLDEKTIELKVLEKLLKDMG